MPFEFVAKKGLTTPGNASVSGSLTVLGQTSLQGVSGSFTGSLTGNLIGTASVATTASYVSASNVVGTVSSASYALSASFAPGSAGETALFIGDKRISGSLGVTASIGVLGTGNLFPIQIINNSNNESEIYNSNTNAGNTASADVVCLNDLGSTATYRGTHYVDLGINSSGYNFGFIGAGNDAYLFNSGSQSSSLWIGNLDLSGSIYLWAGSSTNSGSGLRITSQSISVGVPFSASTIMVGLTGDAARLHISASDRRNIPLFEIDTLLTNAAFLVDSTGSMIISGSIPFPIQVYSNINNESEVFNTNQSAGNTASTDFVAFNDQANTSSYTAGHYIDLGINSSGYSFGFIGKGNDAYLFNSGSQSSSLWIGNLDLSGSIYLWAGSSTNTGSGLLILSQSITSLVPFTASNMSGHLYGTASNADTASFLLGSVSTAISASYAFTSSDAAVSEDVSFTTLNKYDLVFNNFLLTSSNTVQLFPSNSAYMIAYYSAVSQSIFFYGGRNINLDPHAVVASCSAAKPTNITLVPPSGYLPQQIFWQQNNMQEIGNTLYFFGGEIINGFATGSILTASILSPAIVGIATPTRRNSTNTDGCLPDDMAGHNIIRIKDKLWSFFGINNSASVFGASCITRSFTASVNSPLTWGYAGDVSVNGNPGALRLYRNQIVQINETLYSYCGWVGGPTGAATLHGSIYTASINNPLAWGTGSSGTGVALSDFSLMAVGSTIYLVGGQTTGSGQESQYMWGYSASAPLTPIFMGEFDNSPFLGTFGQAVGGCLVLPIGAFTQSYPIWVGGWNASSFPSNGIYTGSKNAFVTTLTQSIPVPYFDISNISPVQSLTPSDKSYYYNQIDRAFYSTTASFASVAAFATAVDPNHTASIALTASLAITAMTALNATQAVSASYSTNADAYMFVPVTQSGTSVSFLAPTQSTFIYDISGSLLNSLALLPQTASLYLSYSFTPATASMTASCLIYGISASVQTLITRSLPFMINGNGTQIFPMYLTNSYMLGAGQGVVFTLTASNFQTTRPITMSFAIASASYSYLANGAVGFLTVYSTASNVSTASFALNTPTSIFSRGGTVYNSSNIPNTTQWVTVWRAAFACTASNMYALATIGSPLGFTVSASVNARKNGSSNILTASGQPITGSSTMITVPAGSLSNNNFNAGDYLDIGLIGITGSISQVMIQLDFNR